VPIEVEVLNDATTPPSPVISLTAAPMSETSAAELPVPCQ